MAAAIEALLHAGIYDLPRELEDYFGVEEYRAEMEEGFDIHVDRLPTGVKKIRAYTSY